MSDRSTPRIRRRGFVGLLGACSVVRGALANSPNPGEKRMYKDPAAPVAARVEHLLSLMTLEEKVAQMLCLWQTKPKIQTPDGEFDPVKASESCPHGMGMIARPSDRQLGGAAQVAGNSGTIVNRTASETARYVNAAQKWAMEKTRLGIPMLMHEEALHGYVARGATSFPQAIGLASSFDPELVEAVFSVAALEMRAAGTQLALAPVVDVARDPRWGRIEETFGEDPHLSTEIGKAAVLGLQGRGLPLANGKVLATLKHMTGHGQPESGTNIGPAQVSERSGRYAKSSTGTASCVKEIVSFSAAINSSSVQRKWSAAKLPCRIMHLAFRTPGDSIWIAYVSLRKRFHCEEIKRHAGSSSSHSPSSMHSSMEKTSRVILRCVVIPSSATKVFPSVPAWPRRASFGTGSRGGLWRKVERISRTQ
jgi:hypothetical protein